MSTMTLDPELTAMYTVLAEKFAALGPIDLPARGDVQALRTLIDSAMPGCPSPASTGVAREDHHIDTSDNASIELRWYTPEGASPAGAGPAVVYLHGGGMVAGDAESYDGLVRYYVQESRVAFAVVEYRLAPEHPGTRMAEDAVDAIEWVLENCEALGVDPERVAVMGDSGGGGIAAGTAILARDRGIRLAKQILVYPMLDDRNVTPDPTIAPFASWTWDSNWTCWSAVLGDQIGAEGVSPVAAPARLADFGGLPPTYIEVGELDIFRDESIAYAQNLHRVGISCELHILPGVTHGHDRLSVEFDISRRSLADRCRVLTTL